MRRVTFFASAMWLCGLPLLPAAAQTYPNRAVSIVVPYPAGGSVDGVARIIAQKLNESLGQHFIGLCRAPPRSGSAHSSEGQPTPRHSGQLSRQQIRCKLLRGLAAASRLSRQRLGDGAIQMERDCHESSVTVHVRKPG